MKFLFVSYATFPFSPNPSAGRGGVELNMYNIAQELLARGHQLQIVTPAGSQEPVLPIQEIEGEWQPWRSASMFDDPAVIPHHGVLANMWDYVREVASEYDLILNFSHEWLSFYLSPFLNRPVLHYVCVGAAQVSVDLQIERVGRLCSGTLGSHTKEQAATYSRPDSFRILGGGIDITQYEFRSEPGDSLAWAGRITPYKGLEDAVAATQTMGIPLKIFGSIEDQAYWEKITHDYPQAPIQYMGFLRTEKFQQELGQCRALLMTHKWIEALGRVALEALACGVPVISYRRGGPIEIIEDGISGYLVKPDSLPDLITAIQSVSKLDRYACRQRVEAMFSMQALGDRLEQWFEEVLRCYPSQ